MTWTAELNALLDAEREALFKVDEGKLAEVLAQKEQLLTSIGSMRTKPRDLETLLAKSQRNQALLDAALRGIRQSTEVVGRYRKQRQIITVYDHLGGRREIQPSAQSSLEKKA